MFIGIELVVFLLNCVVFLKMVKCVIVVGLFIIVVIYLGIIILIMGVFYVDKL